MSFRRFRRQPPQAVEFRGVSMPRTFDDAGDPFTRSNEQASLPRVQNVRRLFDLDAIGSRFSDYSPGYGGRLESPMQALRRVVRSPLASRAINLVPGGFVHRPPKSPSDVRRIQASWSEFRRLQADPRTAMCVRRKSRREVLFALKVAGRSGSGWPRPRRRVESSNWSC